MSPSYKIGERLSNLAERRMRIFDDLGRAAKTGFSTYQEEYLSHLHEALDVQLRQDLVRARLQCDLSPEHEDVVRFAAVFNDVSFVEITEQSQLSIVGFRSEGFASHFGASSIDVSMSPETARKFDLVGKKSVSMTPAFIFPGGEESGRFLSKVQPLVESRRLLVVPNRALLALSGIDEEGRRNWTAHSVDENSPLETWVLVEEGDVKNRPFPVVMDHVASSHARTLFEVCLPYLRGVDFKDLATILDDEDDLVSSLRVAIKDVVTKASADRSSQEIARDTIDPKLDLLSRRFRSLSQAHALKMAGATLGAVTLAFTAVASAGVPGAIATIAGAGGIGLLAKQYAEYREQTSKLAEDPFYFFWRCRQVNQGK